MVMLMHSPHAELKVMSRYDLTQRLTSLVNNEVVIVAGGRRPRVEDLRLPVAVTGPAAFLGDYRRRCVTLGRRVEVIRPGAEVLAGTAVDVDERGALQVAASGGRVEAVAAGDVVHVR
jgi:hypothetical protein